MTDVPRPDRDLCPACGGTGNDPTRPELSARCVTCGGSGRMPGVGRILAPRPDPSAPARAEGGCGHPPESVSPGPRVRLRWGSGPTEVCGRCGAYRVTLHCPGPWQPGPPTPAEEDNDDGDW